jgi:hypothetical protein
LKMVMQEQMSCWDLRRGASVRCLEPRLNDDEKLQLDVFCLLNTSMLLISEGIGAYFMTDAVANILLKSSYNRIFKDPTSDSICLKQMASGSRCLILGFCARRPGFKPRRSLMLFTKC